MGRLRCSLLGPKMLVLLSLTNHKLFLMKPGIFAKKIMTWYAANHRKLPWRQTTDPYRIWLSEVTLQQTRVNQGLPYYQRFIRRFPTVGTLAAASQGQVLRCWQGLGYYTRARNLHACAQEVAYTLGGKFPRTHEGLLALPGIGHYTAAAISSIAFNQPVAVVDGNVYRVLSRLFGITADPGSGSGKNLFANKAAELMAKNNPGTYNQAIMEFGALQCTPKKPLCGSCLFGNTCFANLHHLQDKLPMKGKKVKVRKRYLTYFVLIKNRRVALRKRQQQDIWQGLFDFYAVETPRPAQPAALMKTDGLLRAIADEILLVEVGKPVKHLLTHQAITARFVTLYLGGKRGNKDLWQRHGLQFYTLPQVEQLPKPRMITRFLTESAISLGR